MGYSANASLVYGFSILHDISDELRDRWESGKDDEFIWQNFGDGIEQPFYVSLFNTNTSWEEDREIDYYQLQEKIETSYDKYIAAQEFCKKHGIEWHEPKLLLIASYW